MRCWAALNDAIDLVPPHTPAAFEMSAPEFGVPVVGVDIYATFFEY